MIVIEYGATGGARLSPSRVVAGDCVSVMIASDMAQIGGAAQQDVLQY